MPMLSTPKSSRGSRLAASASTENIGCGVHALRSKKVAFVHDPHAEPCQVEAAVLEDAGVFCGLASEEGAAGQAAPLRHARHDRCDLLRDHPPDRQIVEEEKRLGSRAHD